MKPTPTRLTLRVQARGGKFLGDDIGGAWVVVRDARTTEVLATGVTRGDSGTLCPEYRPGASLQTIVTPGKSPPVTWVIPEPTTSRLDVELALDGPTPIEITAYGPLGGLQSARRTTVAQSIVPGQRNPDPGLVVVLPGLMVQVLEPATHRKLPAGGGTVRLAANVTMMCGCPIDDDEPWIPADFEVAAEVRRAGSPNRVRVPLTHEADEPPSLFRGECALHEPGNYEVSITAVQKSTGNAGAGMVTLIVPES
jgi:hypothetical protein